MARNLAVPAAIRPGSFVLRTAVRLETGWVWLVTLSMPCEERERCRAERIAHLLDHVDDDRAADHTSTHTALGILSRLIVGLPADITYCAEQLSTSLHRRRDQEGTMRWSRNDVVFWVAAAAIILGAVVAYAHFRNPSSNRVSFLGALVGGLIVFRAGAQFAWRGMRMHHSKPLWFGAGISMIGLCVVALTLYLM
jgi:hypothetical protein